MKIAFLSTIVLWLAQPAAQASHNVFKGNTVFGQPLELREERSSKGTVVLFLSAKCPCSASHEQSLKELHSEFSRKGFRFIGIHSNGDESDELAVSHFRSSAFPFPVLRDRDSTLAEEFHAYKTPHAFVLDSKGKIVFQGGVDDSHLAPEAKRHYLKEALIALTEGRNPDPAEVRALGCLIKRKEKP
ncbi:MAG: thioredoxin family protein [Proteobacteria bacterium]|nr:thioredoxin family protein [Pseudomonadota bacterium]